MKVYSLYFKEKFVVAFPNREDAIEYGKEYYDKYAWDLEYTFDKVSYSNTLQGYYNPKHTYHNTPYHIQQHLPDLEMLLQTYR